MCFCDTESAVTLECGHTVCDECAVLMRSTKRVAHIAVGTPADILGEVDTDIVCRQCTSKADRPPMKNLRVDDADVKAELEAKSGAPFKKTYVPERFSDDAIDQFLFGVFSELHAFLDRKEQEMMCVIDSAYDDLARKSDVQNMVDQVLEQEMCSMADISEIADVMPVEVSFESGLEVRTEQMDYDLEDNMSDIKKKIDSWEAQMVFDIMKKRESALLTRENIAVFERYVLETYLDFCGTPERVKNPRSLGFMLCTLGRYHLYTGDSEKGESYLRSAAETGNVEAMVRLCQILFKKNGKNAHDEAMKWLAKAADEGHPSAVSQLGVCTFNGHGVERNLKKAVILWTRAAFNKDVEALYHLGGAHLRGDGVERDSFKARSFWESAAKKGHIESQYEIGRLLEQSRNKDCIRYFASAMNGRHGGAFYRMSVLYEQGKFVERNEQESFAYLQRAADNGSQEGLFMIGSYYLLGKGVERDEMKAKKFLSIAAQKGHRGAQRALQTVCGPSAAFVQRPCNRLT